MVDSMAAMDNLSIAALAKLIGASPTGLRFLISILMTYPIVSIHRQFLYLKSPILQHLFFIIAGSFIGYFNFGNDLVHAYICILVHYFALLVSPGSLLSLLFTFLFQMVYLLGVYYVTDTASYDATWTMPHCVLTLRLIGQAFDIYDGKQDQAKLSGEQAEIALKRIPTILEIAGHVFYPASFLIGPQFPLKRYYNFIEGQFSEDEKPPKSVGHGLKRLLVGMIYIAIFQIGSQFVNNNYMTSHAYRIRPFWQRLLILGAYGKILLYKYISCWIVTEGACILGGVSYNGKNSANEELWDGCENVNVTVFETSYKFSHMISSFNKCTNHWISQYVFKRLKFVGNKLVSQGAALLFLAVWHGLYTGYYMCFFMEFIVMKFEKDLENIFSKNPTIQKWHNSTIGFWIDVVILKVWVMIFFGYCILSFGLLRFDKWWPAYKDLYFIGCLIFGLWPFYGPIVKLLLVPAPGIGKKKKLED